jgi:hypothetical protein
MRFFNLAQYCPGGDQRSSAGSAKGHSCPAGVERRSKTHRTFALKRGCTESACRNRKEVCGCCRSCFRGSAADHRSLSGCRRAGTDAAFRVPGAFRSVAAPVCDVTTTQSNSASVARGRPPSFNGYQHRHLLRRLGTRTLCRGLQVPVRGVTIGNVDSACRNGRIRGGRRRLGPVPRTRRPKTLAGWAPS